MSHLEEKKEDDKFPLAVSCHAWNATGDMVALSPNNNLVYIYATNGSQDYTKWTRKYTLTEHSGFVSAMDWSPVTNKLVTCGHDRNAYVWSYNEETDSWTQALVILRINRAATCVRWSPLGNKFAVGSGAKVVPICHYEESSNWWVSRQLRKHKSTVLSVAWCPNNKLVVTGCSDNKARVFSAYIKGVDTEEDDGFNDVFPNQHNFGEVLAEFDHAKAWVNSVAWAPGGFRIAFAGHGSTMTFVQLLAGAEPKVQTVQYGGLAFLNVHFLSDTTVVAAGWGLQPVLFSADGGDADPTWSFTKKLDDEKAAEKKPVAKSSAFGAARAMFAGATQKGIAIGGKNNPKETVLKTRHQNTITGIAAIANNANVFTTCGVDGKVLFWDLQKLGVSI